MSEHVNLDTIEPGMVVYGADGGEIGPVEAIHQASIQVASQEVPRAAITHVDNEGVHLQVAKIALMARRDVDVEAASNPATTGQPPRSADAAAMLTGYEQVRPHFEEHFRSARRPQGTPGDTTFDTGDFREAEPNYRAGFAAGQDPRYTGRTFDEVIEDFHPARAGEGTGAADDAAWAALRQQLREGFEHARRVGA